MARPRSKSGTWTKVPNWVFAVLPTLKPRAQAALFVLAAEANFGRGLGHLSVAERTGVDPRTAKRALEELMSAGYATKEGGIYQLVAEPEHALGKTGAKRAQGLQQNVQADMQETPSRTGLANAEGRKEVKEEGSIYNSPPYPPSSSTGPSGRLGEEEAAKDAGVQSTGPTALEASLGPAGQAIVFVAPGALHRRVPGRDYTVLDRLRAWDEMWSPEEVRAAWAQAKRDAHTHPLKVFWLILEGEIPLDASLVERPPELRRPKKPYREYRYIGIDDVPDPLEVLYGRKPASA